MYSFHHSAISVSNAEKSLNFYMLFGFKKVAEWRAPDNLFTITNLRNDDVLLELFCYSSPQTPPQHSLSLENDLPTLGIKHFGLKVDSIDKSISDLEDKGIEVLHKDINEDRSGINYFFVKDPDGILVEVVEDNRGF